MLIVFLFLLQIIFQHYCKNKSKTHQYQGNLAISVLPLDSIAYFQHSSRLVTGNVLCLLGSTQAFWFDVFPISY